MSYLALEYNDQHRYPPIPGYMWAASVGGVFKSSPATLMAPYDSVRNENNGNVT